MNNTAINPAATCPDWCVSTHALDWLTPRPSGDWDVLHVSEDVVVSTDEVVPSGCATEIAVATESYSCQTPEENHPRSVWVSTLDTYGTQQAFNCTARQALRLAEVLVQQAAVVLAEESVSLEVTR